MLPGCPQGLPSRVLHDNKTNADAIVLWNDTKKEAIFLWKCARTSPPNASGMHSSWQ
jgi:hypothetical protein